MKTMEATKIEYTEETAIARIRRVGVFRRMRRTRATAIVHGGGNQTIFGCICGSRHTTSTDWDGRHAKHVLTWRDEHAACSIRYAEALDRGEEIELSF